MNKEMSKLLIKASGNNKEALEAIAELCKVYAYGFYGEEKDLGKAKFWADKAKKLEQKLSKKVSLPSNICEIDKIFTDRFDNIQRNLKFVGTKDIEEDKQASIKTFSNRFDNIQNNIQFVETEDDKK